MRLMIVAGSAVLAATVEVGAAQTAPPKLVPKSREPLTIRFTNATLTDVLTLLSVTTGISFQFAPAVTERPVVTKMVFVKATLEDVLTLLLSSMRLTYKIQDEKTVMIIRSQP